MRFFVPAFFLAFTSIASPAEFFSSKQIAGTGDKLLAKNGQFASADLGRYKGHYTMLAARNHTGSAEVHEHEVDYFVMERGGGILITGGKVINPRVERPGEIRGTSIEGGERHTLGVGDVVHIPAGEPHQLLVEKGKPVTYFVVKVEGQ